MSTSRLSRAGTSATDSDTRTLYDHQALNRAEDAIVADPDPQGRIRAQEYILDHTDPAGHVDSLLRQLEGDWANEVREWCLDQLSMRDATDAAFAVLCRMAGETRDDATRLWASTQLGTALFDGVAPRSTLSELYSALITTWHPQVSQALTQVLSDRWTPGRKLAAVVDVLCASEWVTPYSADFRAVAASLGTGSHHDKLRAAAYVVEKARESTTDARVQAVLAALITNLAGSRTEAAALIDQVVLTYNLTEPDVRNLRVEIGGHAALRTILDEVQNDFDAPLRELYDKAMDDWRTTTRAALFGFKARIFMSIVVFVLGTLVAAVSFGLVAAGIGSDRILGSGISFVAGLTSMLVVVYAGPLRDVHRSVEDLGDTNVGFMAFMHQLQFTAAVVRTAYAQGRMSQETATATGELLERASQDWHSVTQARDEPPKSRRRSQPAEPSDTESGRLGSPRKAQ